eukprot:1160224-Pelagomonas_calceolata.AAC.14
MTAFVACMTPLAARGQFSKDDSKSKLQPTVAFPQSLLLVRRRQCFALLGLPGRLCVTSNACLGVFLEAVLKRNNSGDNANGGSHIDWGASLTSSTLDSAVLSLTCVKALSSLAYVAPSAVLPLVITRFRTAVESQTATHQLAATITCFSKCIRPILLSGWGMDSDGESGVQLLAEALMVLLPGIDANDEQKTMAVMQLYTTALSSLPMLAQAGDEEATARGGECTCGSACLLVCLCVSMNGYGFFYASGFACVDGNDVVDFPKMPTCYCNLGIWKSRMRRTLSDGLLVL